MFSGKKKGVNSTKGHGSLGTFIMHLNVDLSFCKIPLAPNTHRKESRSQFFGWGLSPFPTLKEKKWIYSWGLGSCVCVLRKPGVGNNYQKTVQWNTMFNTNASIFSFE